MTRRRKREVDREDLPGLCTTCSAHALFAVFLDNAPKWCCRSCGTVTFAYGSERKLWFIDFRYSIYYKFIHDKCGTDHFG